MQNEATIWSRMPGRHGNRGTIHENSMLSDVIEPVED